MFTFEVTNEEIHGEIDELAPVYEQCQFKNVDFTGMNCSNITFVNCDFINCNFSAVKMGGTILNDCRFVGSKLVGVHFADLAQETLSVSFKECRIDSAIFESVNLKGTNFEESDIVRSEFIWSDLSKANFFCCEFRESRFSNCNFEKANFEGASHLNLDLSMNKVKGAKFSLLSAADLLAPFEIELV